jgi:hypothetical protein
MSSFLQLAMSKYLSPESSKIDLKQWNIQCPPNLIQGLLNATKVHKHVEDFALIDERGDSSNFSILAYQQ